MNKRRLTVRWPPPDIFEPGECGEPAPNKFLQNIPRLSEDKQKRGKTGRLVNSPLLEGVQLVQQPVEIPLWHTHFRAALPAEHVSDRLEDGL